MKPEKRARAGCAKWLLGSSVQGQALECEVFVPEGVTISPGVGRLAVPSVLILGGVHGDEIEGVWLVEALLERWQTQYPYRRVGTIVWPRANPDGVLRAGRWNAAGVDLNRNLPTRDWGTLASNPRYPPGPRAASEPETRALMHLIEVCVPRAIVSAHSFDRVQVNSNGPARQWAEVVSAACGYPVTEDIGYPTPGSLGTWAGTERRIPTLTLEIRRGLSREAVLDKFLESMQKAIQFWDERTSKE